MNIDMPARVGASPLDTQLLEVKMGEDDSVVYQCKKRDVLNLHEQKF